MDIIVARYGARRSVEPFRHWSVPLLVKCRITCLRATLRELYRNTFCITFDDFVGWTGQDMRQSSLLCSY